MGTTFTVSPTVAPPKRQLPLDHEKLLRQMFRRPVEAMWKSSRPLVKCAEEHALISAVDTAFFKHHPLILSPDAIWLTMSRGFALHVGLHAEELRDRFVQHSGKEKIVVERPDFFPGRNNPWPEAFDEFSQGIAQRVGSLHDFLRCDFTTTGETERAASDLMVMDTFQAYFEYEMLAGCGIPSITLTGTTEDWRTIRDRAAVFAEYGLEGWTRALDPILRQFVLACEGNADVEFWRSFYRFHSGSGPAVMTGWIYVLFPYLREPNDRLYPNPYLEDWERRLRTDELQHWRESWDNPQGVGKLSIPPALASAPVKLFWGNQETDMRFVGGLIGVSQDDLSLALRPECGWAVLYEEPIDPLPSQEDLRMRGRLARNLSTVPNG